MRAIRTRLGINVNFTAARLELARHQKTAKGAPPYSRFVNRPMGRAFAAAAYVAGMAPDQVTMLSAAFSAAGIAVIALVDPTWISAVVSVVFLVVGYGLDSADGQLARLRGGGSRAGEWLDHTVDAAKIVSLHLAVLVSLYRFGSLDDERWLLVPIGFTITASVLFFSWVLRDLMVSGSDIDTNRRDDGQRHSVFASLARLLEDYGVLMLVLLVLPATDAFLALYTILFVWSLVMVIVALPKRFRAIDTLDTGR